MRKSLSKFKKILSVMMTAAVLVSMLPTVSLAENSEVSDIGTKDTHVRESSPKENDRTNNENRNGESKTPQDSAYNKSNGVESGIRKSPASPGNNENAKPESPDNPAPKKPAKKIKICLDAGHAGYENKGCKVKKGNKSVQYWESVMTWKLTNYLKKRLETYPNVKVVMTKKSRNDDHGVYDRGRMAKGCNMFLSIHSNWAPSNKTDYPLAIVSAKTKKDGKVLYNKAYPLAKKLVIAVKDTIKTKQNYQIWTKKNNDGTNWYGVIRGAAAVKVPGIILEHSFHSNKSVCGWLLTDANLIIMANKEAEIIKKHFDVEGSSGGYITEAKKPAKVLSAPAKFSSAGINYNQTLSKWNKVSGAKGYKLYRASSKKGKYKLVATVKGLSYKDKKLTSGKVYWYKVKAYRYVSGAVQNGKYSKIDPAKPRPVKPKFSLKAKSKYIGISIGYVAGAKGYRIYRATSKNGKYKYVKNLKGRYWKDKKVKHRKRYYYKVIPYTIFRGNKVNGYYGSAKSVKAK